LNPVGETSQPVPCPIKAVILDFGDVISLPADPEVISWMASVFGVPAERFRVTYGQFRLDYDRGSFDAPTYWTKIGNATGMTPTPEQIAELRKADVAMWSRLNPKVLDWVLELRGAGFKTGVLSNMHDDMVQHLRANGEWTKRFDHLTLSAMLGTVKPDREIFLHCLNGLGVEPNEALFIDDREVNIEGAKQAGIAGIVAPNTAVLAEELERIGFRPALKL
jgi:putative hydrolase of the HAD superfamily